VFKRFLIAVLIFLIAVVIAADRVGAVVGAHVLASKVKTDERLKNRPSASIGGIPFLTQAFGGNYKDVKITATDVLVNTVNVTTLTANLHGVHVPFGKVVHGDVNEVPVDKVDGTAFVSFADANSYLAAHQTGGLIQLGPGSNGTASILDKVKLGGKQVTLTAVGSVSVAGNRVTVAVSHLTSSAGTTNHLASAALNRLHVTIPLNGLPFRLVLESVTVSPTGLTAVGGTSQIVLGSGPSG
jgi:LmeA-like phospholipid-binding